MTEADVWTIFAIGFSSVLFAVTLLVQEEIRYWMAKRRKGRAVSRWRPAKPGETPGQVEPDDDPARDVDAARVRGDHDDATEAELVVHFDQLAAESRRRFVVALEDDAEIELPTPSGAVVALASRHRASNPWTMPPLPALALFRPPVDGLTPQRPARFVQPTLGFRGAGPVVADVYEVASR